MPASLLAARLGLSVVRIIAAILGVASVVVVVVVDMSSLSSSSTSLSPPVRCPKPSYPHLRPSAVDRTLVGSKKNRGGSAFLTVNVLFSRFNSPTCLACNH